MSRHANTGAAVSALTPDQLARAYLEHVPLAIRGVVEEVLVAGEPGRPELVVVVDYPDLETRLQLFGAELRLWDAAPNAYDDFRLLVREGSSVDLLLDPDTVTYTYNPRSSRADMPRASTAS